MGEMVSFASNGDSCEGYLARPESGDGPGVIVIQEYWGLVDHIKSVADRVAKAGFVALAPDFFHGATAGEPDEAQRLLMGLAMDRAAKDIDGAAQYLSAMDGVDDHGVGVVGFCMGGSLALWSGTLSDRVKVAVGFYPAMPWEKMSPSWGNYANKVAMIHASEEDGTSRAEGIADRHQEHRAGRWRRRGLRLPRFAPRVLQRRASRGPLQGARRQGLAADHQPLQVPAVGVRPRHRPGAAGHRLAG